MSKLNPQEIIYNVQDKFLKKEIPNIQIGDNVKIGVKIIEGNKERVQFYEGTIIAFLVRPQQFSIDGFQIFFKGSNFLLHMLL